MSLRRRLFLTLVILVLAAFFSVGRWVRGEWRNSYPQLIEEFLVDGSQWFASYLERQGVSQKSFTELEAVFAQYKNKHFQAKIYDYFKNEPSLDLYVTDEKGVVLFSTRKNEVGKDFSAWNDVYKTLRGEYGARSTRVDPNDSRSSVYYVAAPVVIDGKTAGVVTLQKTENSVLFFIDRALDKMFIGGLLSVFALGLIGGLILLWITFPLEKLRQYALDISAGQRSSLPKSTIKEVKHLGEAFEKMRVSLEGKKTVEKYTQTLTHELKSPLTAIKGAAELCLEEMDGTQRRQFLNNIISEANRSHSLLEQLLKIAALESKSKLENRELVRPADLIDEAKAALMGIWKAKEIQLHLTIETDAKIHGDRFLLFQAFRNILQNAVEFSEPKTEISTHVSVAGKKVTIEVRDQGSGIPDFAKDRIFEKFYSLERPDTKRKSSGLGLSFVKEVVELHRGEIEVLSPLKNNKGTSVRIHFALD